MGAGASKGGNAISPEGDRLDKLMGKDRPAVGRKQVAKATMDKLSQDMLEMAKKMDEAVSLANAVAGTNGDKASPAMRLLICPLYFLRELPLAFWISILGRAIKLCLLAQLDRRDKAHALCQLGAACPFV